uniref:Uncharacterized protein n=1 Tax=Arundo donax TaxID=35708 RepID=A0A0A9B9C0_ARUDO
MYCSHESASNLNRFLNSYAPTGDAHDGALTRRNQNTEKPL